jgi:transcriptional regulator with XRE-family HTH domain
METDSGNQLAANLKYLRKKKNLSQQQLAEALSIKRSNIAAYETKNVEPRLSLIHKMSEYFNVSLSHLICEDMSLSTGNQEKKGGAFFYDRSLAAGTNQPALPSLDTLRRFKQQSLDVRKMLEGFKVFYDYKKTIHNPVDTQQRQFHAETENFLIFIEHMLQYNESVIQLMDQYQLEEGEA